MEKTEIAALIASRPRAFGWIRFQKFLFWVCFVLGTLCFSFTGFIIFENIIDLYFFTLLKDTNLIGEKQQMLFELMAIIKLSFVLGSFFISIILFIMARYCHKVVRRNEYILKLEDAVETYLMGKN